ncbi:hypothetical protein FQN51_000658 [Onygenales sp. PD_10]|nr:hypothetical protein FQN51_000658 [Onygenales sp. PD_10]
MVTEYDQSSENVVYWNDDDRRSQVSRLEMQMKDNDARLEALEDQVKSLALTSEGYMTVRLRLFATFRRNFLGEEPIYIEPLDSRSAVAHYGDAVADANLVLNGGSKDVEIIRILYGRTYGDILVLEHGKDSETIAILNKRATLVLQYGKAPPATEKAFQKYLTELDLHSGSKPKDDTNSQLSELYTQFWEECQKFRKGE